MLLTNCLAVGLGGFLGAVARYLLGFVPGYQVGGFPLGTMLINLIGAFCIGLVVGAASFGVLNGEHQLFLKTGFCGGFTTFSTFSLEAMTLLQQQQYGMAGTYMAASVAVCLAGVCLGQWAARVCFGA